MVVPPSTQSPCSVKLAAVRPVNFTMLPAGPGSLVLAVETTLKVPPKFVVSVAPCGSPLKMPLIEPLPVMSMSVNCVPGLGGEFSTTVRVRPVAVKLLVAKATRLHRRQTIFSVQAFVGSTMVFHADVMGVPLKGES